jgi:hypothetical protein
MLIALLVISVIEGAVAIALAMSRLYWFIPLILLAPLAVALFLTLTVRVTVAEVDVRFGPGWIGKTIPMNEIMSVRQVENPWYWGYGIRFWGDAEGSGWLYNVSGPHGVELRMRDGSRFRIGTDDPHGLEAAIKEALRHREVVSLD